MTKIEETIQLESYDEGEPEIVIKSNLGNCGYSERDIRIIANDLGIDPLFMVIRIAFELSMKKYHTGKRPYQNIIEGAQVIPDKH